jgi:uncharacterized protein (DUF433 family)
MTRHGFQGLAIEWWHFDAEGWEHYPVLDQPFELLENKPEAEPTETGGDQEETTMDYRARIVRDRRICGGQPVIQGTRVPLRTVLASLAEGDSIESILEDFPTLTEEDVRAVIAFAAASAEEDLPVPEIPHVA